MSQTVDDGYDSDTMIRVDNKIKREIEGVQAKCFQQIEMRLLEDKSDVSTRMTNLEISTKSQITETQVAISAIQLDQEKMLDKVRSSQTEVLMINKNLAANLKK